MKEVALGRVVGPFPTPPFPNFHISPIGLVPKKHSDKFRAIFHLSFPKSGTTTIVDKTDKKLLVYLQNSSALMIPQQHSPPSPTSLTHWGIVGAILLKTFVFAGYFGGYSLAYLAKLSTSIRDLPH